MCFSFLRNGCVSFFFFFFTIKPVQQKVLITLSEQHNMIQSQKTALFNDTGVACDEEQTARDLGWSIYCRSKQNGDKYLKKYFILLYASTCQSGCSLYADWWRASPTVTCRSMSAEPMILWWTAMRQISTVSRCAPKISLTNSVFDLYFQMWNTVTMCLSVLEFWC